MSTRAFGALQVAGYRWLLLNSFALSAAWTTESLGQGWLVLQMTDSPFWVGVAVGVRGTGQLVFGLLGGVVVDRLDRRRLLLTNHVITALVATAIALLIQTEAIRLWHVLLSAALSGAIGALNGPAHNALTYDVVGPSRLLNASALRATVGSLIRVVAALTGGLIIELLGLWPNYLLVAVAFVAAGACLLPLRSPKIAAERRESSVRAAQAGFRYAVRTRSIRQLLLLSVVTEGCGFSYNHMKPVIARDVLQVGAAGLGYLEAASAAGQLVAMMVLASLGDVRQKGWLVVGNAFGFGFFIVLFGLSPWFAASLVLSALAGAMGGIYDSALATIIQLNTISEMRGRVLGLLVTAYASNQVGGLGLGALGALIGVPTAVAIGGGLVAANAARLVRDVRFLSPAVAAESPAVASTP